MVERRLEIIDKNFKIHIQGVGGKDDTFFFEIKMKPV